MSAPTQVGSQASSEAKTGSGVEMGTPSAGTLFAIHRVGTETQDPAAAHNVTPGFFKKRPSKSSWFNWKWCRRDEKKEVSTAPLEPQNQGTTAPVAKKEAKVNDERNMDVLRIIPDEMDWRLDGLLDQL